MKKLGSIRVCCGLILEYMPLPHMIWMVVELLEDGASVGEAAHCGQALRLIDQVHILSAFR